MLGQSFLSTLGGRLATQRDAGLALVYHRVRPTPKQAHEVVPCVAVEQFHRHIMALLAMGDIVPVEELTTTHGTRRPRFALTFDDDYASHFRHVLPILCAFNLPATFFLSGRSLHGLGPYWWEVLETRIHHDGPKKVARALDVPCAEPQAIAAACEEDPVRQQHLEAGAADATDQLRPNEISALASAGMAIGFHTVEHRALPALTAAERFRALTDGREQLQQLSGQHLKLLAYPHGRADDATATDTRAAGYEAAWTGAGHAVSRRSNPWLLARWEVGPIHASALRAGALARFLRPTPTNG